jgi:cytochrome b subunit of formate dehydrogenase
MVPVKNADSPVFKLNLPQTCARCHSNPGLTAEYRMKYPQAAAQYMESIHGRALLQMGLIVAPACNDCHGVHDIRRGVDSNSPIHNTNIPKTCGKCHVGTEKVCNQSIHGQLLVKGDKRAPTCNDCHTAHQIQPPGKVFSKAVADERCGSCHQDRLKKYRETYHGKAMALGRPNVAACFDCHGHHDVFPPGDPRSRLASANIVQTCKQCHPGASVGFTKYMPHADPMDRVNYPALHWTFVLMTALLVGTFGFFGVHTVFWLFRSAYMYHVDSKAFREARIQAEADDEWYTRFTPFERFLHFLMVTSFLLLVVTGMPLKFYYTGWAKAIFDMIGGVEVARSLHRFGAIITFFYFGLHLMWLVSAVWGMRADLRDPATGKLSLKRAWGVLLGPDTMMPWWQDWRDFIAHQKWFFGRGPRPQFDRWTYWEKFDYFAVFWGVFFIGLSGLVMWASELSTLFLPGWVINVALIIHSDEALLAAGFIFAFHFFNVHFRPEKFPMDPIIFSGRISKTELVHARKRWYDRMVAQGRLGEWRVKDEWERWKKMTTPLGYMMFGLGVTLLVLIVYAMTVRLTH